MNGVFAYICVSNCILQEQLPRDLLVSFPMVALFLRVALVPSHV